MSGNLYFCDVLDYGLFALSISVVRQFLRLVDSC